ncbi:Major facilitator superfamily domain, general substrate transporter [Penicillium expansum]|uniref:Major facilitator superfamily domain, general substrate transporter n=1 Tax=Penicillium expansum TaxID=27334 RepID=A0A0A2JK74_PENEN|nr:Major facilitator superfamily domain, general substrate transporter [Penicillium expansum]KGO39280.1 Major facilitator superfamily domain, general substrate transporter [Penicillium expansum]KGO47218.1 Major facilitator superfamily domain, general substrate transporter [Penicillium expansum]KGO55206.1 Major facilitator superfamily domain, general substrate transporter [Penicillium expansum]
MYDDRTAELEKGSPTSLRPSSPAEPKPQASGPPAAPEGGTKAYLSLLGGSLGLFISFGWVNCIALFQAEYQTNQLKTYSSSEVSWITSSECESLLPQPAVKQQAHFNLVFFMLFMSPLSGYLFDNYGPRLPICIGGLMHVFGLMMTSLSSKYYQFYLAQSICSGTGTSLIFTPAMTSPMTYFRKRRALAGGLTVAGSSLGGVIFPLMVNNLLSEVGFAWTMRICAFLILGLWAIAMLTISSNLPHTRKELNLANYLRPFTEFNFLILLAFCFFLYWALFVPFDYLVLSAMHNGMSMTMAYNLIPIMNGASFFGRTIPNGLADKYGRFNVLIIMLLFTGVITLALWLPGRSNAANIVFAALFGIGSGTTIGLTPPLVMTLYPPQEIGFRIGLALAIAGIGALTSPPIAGAIAGTDGGSFRFAALFSGMNFMVATILLVWLRGRVSGWNALTKA